MKTGIPMAVPWYPDESNYLAVLGMLPASERENPLAYDVFRSKLELLEKECQRGGSITRRVPIDAIALKAWCDANGHNVCRKTIGAFITFRMVSDIEQSTGKN